MPLTLADFAASTIRLAIVGSWGSKTSTLMPALIMSFTCWNWRSSSPPASLEITSAPSCLARISKEFRSVCQRSPFMSSMENPIFGLFPSCACTSCPLTTIRTITNMTDRTASLRRAFVKISSSIFMPSILPTRDRSNRPTQISQLPKTRIPHVSGFPIRQACGLLSPDCSNCPGSHSQLLAEPLVSGFSAESWMPGHEIRKGLDLARRFHNAYASHPGGDLCQSAGHSKDQIGLSDGKDRRHKERKTEHDTPLRAKLRQRAIHQGLLTSQGFDQRVRKLQILFQRKTARANPQSGAYKTNKVQI